jgi:hypothetical protein
VRLNRGGGAFWIFGLYSIITGKGAYLSLVDVNIFVCDRLALCQLQVVVLLQVPPPMIFPSP